MTPVRMVVVGDWCCARLTSCTRFKLPTCNAPMSQSSGLFHILLFSVLVRVTSSRCLYSLPPHVILMCTMRTLNPWYQTYPLGSIGTDSLGIVALGGFWDSVPCVLDSRAFVATRNFTCATSTIFVSTNFLFMEMRSNTMFQLAVDASARLSSAVAISVVSWASWAILNHSSPNTRCCSRIS